MDSRAWKDARDQWYAGVDSGIKIYDGKEYDAELIWTTLWGLQEDCTVVELQLVLDNVEDQVPEKFKESEEFQDFLATMRHILELRIKYNETEPYKQTRQSPFQGSMN